MSENQSAAACSAKPEVDVDVPVLRQAEDGSEALYALARNLRAKGSVGYADQIERDAAAIRQLTDRHPAADPSPADGIGAKEHATHMAMKLGLNSNA